MRWLARAPDRPPNASFALPTRRLLLVDDVRDVADAMAALAARVRHVVLEVDVATSVAAALEKLAVRRYDVVISDLRLDDGDGLQVLARAAATAPASRRVLMTGYGEVPFGDARFRVVTDDWLSKPIDPQGFLLALVGMLTAADAPPFPQESMPGALPPAFDPGIPPL